MARRYYSSTAARTTLASGVNNSTTTLSVVAVSGWPSSFPYTIILDQDTVNEEIVEVTNRSGTTLTVTRGVDGTTAKAHDGGASVNHGVSARDFDEPNAFINGTGTVTETLLASNAVTSAKILDGTIVNADINASAAIAQSKIANLTSDLASKVDYATPTNAQSGTAYTFVGDDAFRLTTSNSASAVTFTIPAASAVAWEDDTILRVVNYGAGALTVAGGSGVTVTNTASTLSQYQGAAALRTGSDAWTLVPFGESAFSATGGNQVATVGGYRYHLFTSSSTFVVESGSGNVEIAVIGAGGGGGKDRGGGGGGGAKEPSSGYTTQTLSAGNYTVTVASGGAGSTSTSSRGGSPSATSFVGTATISANGGGGGGSPIGVQSGASGGSGGGAHGTNGGGSASGSNTNTGSNGNTDGATYTTGGGGGGATAAASIGGGNVGGNGGAGLLLTTIDANLTSANFSTFSGMTRICSGGGGGTNSSGTAGTGGTGAGNGSNSAAGGNATSFGSGGGGGSQTGPGNGGNGYGGLVIVRYAV